MAKRPPTNLHTIRQYTEEVIAEVDAWQVVEGSILEEQVRRVRAELVRLRFALGGDA